MPPTVRTLEEIRQRILRDYQAILPGVNTSERSDAWVRATLLAMDIWALEYRLCQMYRDLFPDTAVGEEADRWANLYGQPRLPAVGASGADALEVTGTAGAPVPLDAELTDMAGLRYKTAEATVIPPAGTVRVDVAAIDTGPGTNLTSGTRLTFRTTPPGLDSTATLRADLTGGAAEESDGALQRRLADLLGRPRTGGNGADWKAWARAVAGVANAYVYPKRRGLGTTDVAILRAGEGAARVPDAALRTAVIAALESLRPVTVKDFGVLLPTPAVQDFDLQVAAVPGVTAFDWDDSSGYHVLAYTVAPGLVTLQLDAAVPPSLTTGKSVQVLGEERRALSAAGDTVVLESELSAPPAIGTPVYSGGPIVAALQAAVRAHMAALGPARGSYADPDDTSWTSDLSAGAMQYLAYQTGLVMELTVVAPALPVRAADTGSGVELLVPGTIVVRRAP